MFGLENVLNNSKKQILRISFKNGYIMLQYVEKSKVVLAYFLYFECFKIYFYM